MSTISPKGKGKADKQDKKVGLMLRERRLKLGLSQQKLAEKIGVTFQQVQKYERGINRVSASRLQQLSNALEVSVGYFFDNDNSSQHNILSGFSETEQKAFINKDASADEVKELLLAFSAIDDEKVRKQIIEMAKSLSEK